MNLFDQMLSRYNILTNDDYINAQHEVMQQVTLAGLYRGGFFNKAAFYGGTCLRIFYGLQRFSEDMDFSLLQPDVDFKLEHYFEPIITALLLATAQLVRQLVALVAQAYFLQHLLDPLVHPLGIVPTGGLHHELQVLVHRAVREQLEILEHDAQLAAQVGDLAALQHVQVEAADMAFTLCEREVTVERAHQAALACAGAAHQVDELARTYRQVHVVQHKIFTLEDPCVVQFDDGGSAHGRQRSKFPPAYTRSQPVAWAFHVNTPTWISTQLSTTRP